MKRKNLLVWILTLGVFGILTTEMGVIGILPSIADHYHISISKAGYLVSLFALVMAISGPTMPSLFSGINRKKVMLLVRNARKSVIAFPIALGAVYLFLFLMGQFTVPMALITLVWGILGGHGRQYQSILDCVCGARST